MTGYEILCWVLVGIIAGALAKAVVPGEAPWGLLGDLVVGIVGAFLGGWLFHVFGYRGAQVGGSAEAWVWSILVAFIGAVVLLLLIRGIRRTST